MLKYTNVFINSEIEISSETNNIDVGKVSEMSIMNWRVKLFVLFNLVIQQVLQCMRPTYIIIVYMNYESV